MFITGVRNVEFSRSTGEVDVFIGLDYVSFHTQMVDNLEHLVAYENHFGKYLGGRYSGLKEDTHLLIVNVEINQVTPEFSSYENLGVEYPSHPNCRSCHSQKCFETNEFSLKEQRDLALIVLVVQQYANTQTQFYYKFVNSIVQRPYVHNIS